MATLLLFPFTFISLSAQQYSNRYGKITDQELKMTTYPLDTAAHAVVVFNIGEARYDYMQNGFRITYSFEKKIKILTSEGTKYADITIPYYNNEKNSNRKESVVSIDAVAYNMENGKTERIKMKSEYVFRERVNSNYMQVKFSIPAVKAGTVIEYKYKLLSDYIESIDSWEIQEEIPVIFSKFDISIPEYFKFNIDMRGGVKVDTEDKSVNMSINLGGSGPLNLTARNMIFTAHNVPSMKSDGYLWCPEDYKSRVEFELHGVQFPYDAYRSFTSTWNKIDEQLLKYDDFGKHLKMRNPYRDEASAMLSAEMSVDEKIAHIFSFVRQKISWNENYSIFSPDIRKAIKEGSGSNADINFVLMSMLRDANIPCVPLVMSRRSRGMLPMAHPSIAKLNTFVVGIQNSDTTMVYLDGSVQYGYINILPPVLLTNRARIISESGGERWRDLSNLGRSQIRSMANITMYDDGKITGERKSGYSGQYAAEYRERYKDAKSQEDFIEKLETDHSLKVSDFKLTDLEAFTPELTEEFTFEKQAEVNGDYIYLNPMIFKHISTNPFVQEERQLPVEFPYASSVRLSYSITIPDGFKIEELPKGQIITLDDKGANCRYLVQQSDNKVMLNYLFTLNKTFFLPAEYEQLRAMYVAIVERNNEMIVLKRSAE